jgi:hypothetical protein
LRRHIDARSDMCATGRVHAVAWIETGRIGGTGLAWEVRQCDRGYARACTGVFPGAVRLGESRGKDCEGFREGRGLAISRGLQAGVMEVDGEKVVKSVRRRADIEGTEAAKMYDRSSGKTKESLKMNLKAFTGLRRPLRRPLSGGDARGNKSADGRQRMRKRVSVIESSHASSR